MKLKNIQVLTKAEMTVWAHYNIIYMWVNCEGQGNANPLIIKCKDGGKISWGGVGM